MLRAALPLGVQLLPALRFGPALLQARHATTVASSSAGNGQKEGASHKVAAAFSLAAAATFAGSQWQAQADAAPVVPSQPPADPYARPAATGRLPENIILYQYEVCPFCCKVKAMLDYYKLPYETVEVNPLTKAELKWSKYRKVPVVKLDGEQVVVDSSAIMSQLAAELEAAGVGAKSSTEAPAAKGGTKQGGWFSRSSGGDSSISGGSQAAGQVSEEQRWRRWVDERFVRVLTANIYRSWDETWNTFGYIAGQSNWNWASQQAVRVAGSLIMWRVGKGMPAKYNIEGDLREALYKEVNTFVEALGSRDFMGGSSPNLADLAMFGVLRAVAGTPTYNDIVINSKVGPWLARMTIAVGESAEVKAAKSSK